MDTPLYHKRQHCLWCKKCSRSEPSSSFLLCNCTAQFITRFKFMQVQVFTALRMKKSVQDVVTKDT